MKFIDKQNEDLFEGWIHQTDFNRDQLILSDILRRKTKKGNFPRLGDLKIQQSSNNPINSQIKLQPVRIKHLLNLQYKKRGIRQKTEGCKQLYSDTISPLKKKLVEILNEEHLQTKNTPQTIIQQQIKQNGSQLTILKDQHDQQLEVKNKLNQHQKKFKATYTLQKMKSKQLFGNRLKKTQSKMYVKLNDLQILEDYKKNIFKDTVSIKNLSSKNHLLQENNLKHTTQSHKDLFQIKHQIQQKNEKVSQKLKQTFFKIDLFEKDKRKKKTKIQRLDLVTQLNDKMLFTNIPFKLTDQFHKKCKSPFKTIQKSVTAHQNLQKSIKMCSKTPHRYQLTID